MRTGVSSPAIELLGEDFSDHADVVVLVAGAQEQAWASLPVGIIADGKGLLRSSGTP